MDIGLSEAAYEGIKATVSKVLNASWQRCRVQPDQIPRLDSDQADRCDRKLPLASLVT